MATDFSGEDWIVNKKTFENISVVSHIHQGTSDGIDEFVEILMVFGRTTPDGSM